MRKYEAMFIIKPDLSEEERKNLLHQISDAVNKHSGAVTQASIWQERKKLYFPLKKYKEGTYYLMNFEALPAELIKIKNNYRMNENILRVLITVKE